MPSRLKSLELHGYKTFASRILFEFPVDVTCIVGPNGSGKSNVADAIRWVLGEQSYTLLRAKRTEDMIFSGSDQRSRSGMAFASIVFDNCDGWLPIDYSEVCISRRAYRDGQNEYLLNGQRVRLKEIYELLAQSGLAQRTYTIIGQGLVDAALSLKPDERRQFFEDAAGIGLYRKRREEALSRLEVTRRNMERVTDILVELEPRLKTLERQSARVQEQERIKADLKLLMREWYGFHWHRIQRELARSKEEVRIQERNNKKTREKKTQVDSDLEQVRSKISSLRSDLDRWHTENSAAHRRRETISRDLAVAEERLKSLLERHQGYEVEISKLQEEEKSYQESIRNIEVELRNVKNEKDQIEEKYRKVRDRFDLQDRTRQEAQKKLEKWQNARHEFETQGIKLNARHQELIARQQYFEKSRHSLDEQIEKSTREIDLLEVNLRDVEEHRRNKQEKIDQFERLLADKNTKLMETSEEATRINGELTVLQAEKSRLAARLEVLRQAEESNSYLNKSAQNIMKANRQGRLSGKYQSLMRQLEVEPEYEKAITAALGEFLDGILLQNEIEVEEILKFLENDEKGKAVLLPRNLLRSHPVEKAHQTDGLLNAIDLVSTNAENQAIVETILGHVFISKDYKHAVASIQNIPVYARIVTMNGEVLHGSGAIVSAIEGRVEVISNSREVKTLQHSISQLDTKHANLEKTLGENQKRLEREKNDLHTLEEQRKTLDANYKEINSTYRDAQRSLEQAQQQLVFQHRQVDEINKQESDTKSDIEGILQSLEENRQQLSSLERQISEQAELLSSFQLSELQEELNQWQMDLALVNRSIDETNRRLDDFIERRDGIQLDIQNRQEQLAADDQEIRNIREMKSDYQTQEAAILEQIASVQDLIDPHEKALVEQESELNRLQDEQMRANQELTTAERFAAQAQLEYSRRKDDQETLRNRIEDDFGLVAFEYETDLPGPTPLPLKGFVDELPLVKDLPPEIEDNINRQRSMLRRLGPINPEARKEYELVSQRYEFLHGQLLDLEKAIDDLKKVIKELDELMKIEFLKTFEEVSVEFRKMFTRLFGGGSAKLILIDEENPVETGIEIEALLPGKRKQGLALLSGGERSLTAVALIFSLLKVSPTPFCVLDEVDAALDEANVGRFSGMLRELSKDTQFLVITHNRNTVQISDVIYGVTMGRDSTSQVISLKLDEVSEELVQ
jgi:chromosome segregation protein